MLRALVGCALALFVATSAAAQPARMPVQLQRTGTDEVGNALTFRVRDEIGRSGQLREATTSDGFALVVHLVTMDPDDMSRQTVYSLVINLRSAERDEYYFTTFVGVCGANQTAVCGARIYQNIGSVLEQVRQLANTPRASRPNT